LKLVFIAPGTLEIPVVKYGGIERVIWNLANGFTEKGYSVKVLAKRNKSYEDKLKIIFDPYEDNGILINDIVNIKENLTHHSKEYLSGIFTYLQNNLEKDDVVFLNHSEQKDIRNYLEAKKIKFFEIGHYKNFSGNTNIIFPSNFLKNMFFLKQGIVIPHPIDFQEFYIVDETPLIKEKYLLYVGRVNKHKRTKLVYKIAQQLGIKCVIAGIIEDKKYANQFIKECIYMGNCTSSELRNLYTFATATACVTSIFPPEAFGLFQVEAQACGSIVISSKNAGLKDTFFDNCCIEYSNYKGINNVCNKFNKMINSKNVLTKKEISDQARKNFSTEAVVSMYIEKLKL